MCLNELLLQYLDDYKEVYAYRHVQVEVYVEECFRLEMSESLAIVLLTNLLKNAFVHVTEGEWDFLFLSLASSFRISNTGDASLDKNRIFERFYKEGKAEGSTGLGLALVDSICKAYHLTLSYTFEDGQHIFLLFLDFLLKKGNLQILFRITSHFCSTNKSLKYSSYKIEHYEKLVFLLVCVFTVSTVAMADNENRFR